MQRGAPVDTQNLCGLLELLLAVISFFHVIVVVFFLILVAAPGRSITLPLLGLAAESSPAIEWPLLAGLSSASLGLLLVATLVFSLLLFYEVLYPFAVLEIVALGAVDLTVLLVSQP